MQSGADGQVATLDGFYHFSAKPGQCLLAQGKGGKKILGAKECIPTDKNLGTILLNPQ